MMTEMYRTIHGSAHDIPLPDGSVQCIVTSPPYWGLRRYAGEQGVEWPAVDYAPMPGLPTLHVDVMRCELGLEPTPEAYIGHMVLCLREWRRVLRDDGVCFVNLGDSYAGGVKQTGRNDAGRNNINGFTGSNGYDSAGGSPPAGTAVHCKPKDMVGIPWRFAFAVQADGWWLRSDIIWAKPNPMPESVTDRPTKAHEYVFLLTKSQRYYYDADAVREKVKPENSASSFDARETHKGWGMNGDGQVLRFRDTTAARNVSNPAGRNVRDVWTMATEPTSFAHFATFSSKLAEKCILAGTSARGRCPECGAPWRRVVERTAMVIDHSNNHPPELRTRTSGTMVQPPTNKTTGWQPTCTCFGEFADSAILRPCVVLDPFHGSGTTGVVALRLGRSYVGVDISEEYLHGVTAERMGDGVQIGMAI